MPPVCLSEQMRSVLRFDVLKFLTLFQPTQQYLYLRCHNNQYNKNAGPPGRLLVEH